jgi:hypothetical protein
MRLIFGPARRTKARLPLSTGAVYDNPAQKPWSRPRATSMSGAGTVTGSLRILQPLSSADADLQLREGLPNRSRQYAIW